MATRHQMEITWVSVVHRTVKFITPHWLFSRVDGNFSPPPLPNPPANNLGLKGVQKASCKQSYFAPYYITPQTLIIFTFSQGQIEWLLFIILQASIPAPNVPIITNEAPLKREKKL